MRYFEDIAEGEAFELGSRQMDADDMVAFAREYDPQPFHVDEEAAKRTPFGGLIASGWMTLAIMARLGVDGLMSGVAPAEARTSESSSRFTPGPRRAPLDSTAAWHTFGTDLAQSGAQFARSIDAEGGGLVPHPWVGVRRLTRPPSRPGAGSDSRGA